MSLTALLILSPPVTGALLNPCPPQLWGPAHGGRLRFHPDNTQNRHVRTFTVPCGPAIP